MSRVAKNPVLIPKGVTAQITPDGLSVKGPKGVITTSIHPQVAIAVDPEAIRIGWEGLDTKQAALAGTTRANVANMVHGVSAGYERKLTMVGVGYRAQAKGNILNLSLGFSHPIDFIVPEGITIETPTQTEIVIKGCDKQRVGQTAANIRAFRPPEPYKGKGVRYSDEVIIRKEAKKK